LTESLVGCRILLVRETAGLGDGRRASMHVTDLPEIARLSTAEKILLVEELWDSLAADESSVPVPQSHKDELDRRLARYRANPGDLLPLEELQTRIERRR
jgi:putative addiction module component (TIGR02574 family)